MLKLGLWVGAPALATYLIASHTLGVGHVIFIVLVAVMAAAVGLVRLPDRIRRPSRGARSGLA